MTRRALITGIGGQDGAYLSQFLCDKDYEVAGIDLPGTEVMVTPDADTAPTLALFPGNIADRGFVQKTIAEFAPQEIYHLAGRSHVGQSFTEPVDAVEINSVGTMNVLNALGGFSTEDRPRVMNASSCEIFGPGDGTPMNEATPLDPQSPYALSKELALNATKQARKVYGVHVSNGIFFNHESPLRPETYVTRKISRSVAAIAAGRQERLSLGNLNARRDWGHARDFVDGMWRMLQQDRPSDYVLATGKAHSVRAFVECAFAEVGITLDWEGEGINEVGRDGEGEIRVRVDPAFFRPVDIPDRVGNAAKARSTLQWEATIPFKALVAEMVAHDRQRLTETNIDLPR